MLSCFDTISERDGRMDRRTEVLYQCHDKNCTDKCTRKKSDVKCGLQKCPDVDVVNLMNIGSVTTC